jgi:hypothetical protein
MYTHEEWLKMEKLAEGKTTKELAAILGCTVPNAWYLQKRLRARDYPPPGIVKHHKPIHGNRGQVRHRPSKEYIPALQAMSRLTLQEVGEQLNLTRERVRQLYVLYGIPRRRLTAVEKACQLITPELLQKYTDGTRHMREACAEFGTYPEMIKACAAAHGVRLLFRTDARRALAAQGLRRCNICHNELPLDQFVRISKPRGRGYSCKDCTAANARRWYDRHRHDLLVLHHPELLYLGIDGRWTSSLRMALLITNGQRQRYKLYEFPEGTRFLQVQDKVTKLLTAEELVVRIGPRGYAYYRPPQHSGAKPLPAHGAGEG